jgi:DNA-binding transcriptional ArsR family regulator
MSYELKPTLWRTMRVLANPVRLRLLAELFNKSPLCVKEAAQRCGVSRVVATQQLRQLQARGLIRSRRVVRWALYTPEADAAVTHAESVNRALRCALQARPANPAGIMKQVTAYTHERRIRLVGALAGGPASATELAARCGMSLPAAVRHLDKLYRRGVITWQDGDAQLAPATDAFARALRRLAVAEGGCLRHQPPLTHVATCASDRTAGVTRGIRRATGMPP